LPGKPRAVDLTTHPPSGPGALECWSGDKPYKVFIGHARRSPGASIAAVTMALAQLKTARIVVFLDGGAGAYVHFHLTSALPPARARPIALPLAAYREFVAGPYVVRSSAFLKLPTGS